MNKTKKNEKDKKRFSRHAYDLEEHLITGKQKLWKKIIEWSITILGWAVLLSFILYFSYGFLALQFHWYLPQFYVYNTQMLMQLKQYFFILFIAALIFAVLLILWKNYNLKRFGKLNRRKFRAAVSDEELLELFQVSEEQLHMLKNDRLITLEKNIIPEDLGMGREKRDEKSN